jgi:hypothetical protein
MAVLTGFFPCKPPFLSSFVCPDMIIIRVFFSILEFGIWQQIMIGGSYYVLFSMVVPLSFLWIRVDSHIKQSYTIGLKNGRNFQSYKNLQVLTTIINCFLRNRLLPLFAWIYPILQILLLCIFIKLFQSNPVKASMFAFLYISVAVFTIGIFSAGATVHNSSKEWMKVAKQSCKTKIERKMYASIMPLKLYFANNFVDTLTPCVIQDFCARQTASLLLLGKN